VNLIQVAQDMDPVVGFYEHSNGPWICEGREFLIQLSSYKIYKQKYTVVQDVVAFLVNTTVYSSKQFKEEITLRLRN
jgi:hypothetical protein